MKAAFFAFICLLVFAAPLGAKTNSKAEILRQTVELNSSEQSAVLFDDEVVLPMGDVFNQGNSNWCWAYAAFHTIRTYYFNLQDGDEAERAWGAAVTSINSSGDFRQFMNRHSDPSQSGHPSWFIDLIQLDDTGNLPDQEWIGFAPWDLYGKQITSYTTTGFVANLKGDEYLSREGIIAKLEGNLRNGVASTWCGIGHCVTIFGATFNGDQVSSYFIADSASSSPTYQSSAQRMHSNLELLMTLNRQ